MFRVRYYQLLNILIMRIFSSFFEHDRKDGTTVKIYQYRRSDKRYKIETVVLNMFGDKITETCEYAHAKSQADYIFICAIKKELTL